MAMAGLLDAWTSCYSFFKYSAKQLVNGWEKLNWVGNSTLLITPPPLNLHASSGLTLIVLVMRTWKTLSLQTIN